MPETFGTPTKPSPFFKAESYKLHHEFVVKSGSTVKKGQPVKLHTDGTVLPVAAGDSHHLCIGVSIHNGEALEAVTVSVRGYLIVNALAADVLAAGPVKYSAQDATTGLPKYSDDSVTAAIASGWALGAAVAIGDPIQVLLY